MNPLIKSRLRNIFAKEINKVVSDLTNADNELFEDWISVGLAAIHIPAIKADLAANQLPTNDEPSNIRDTYDLAKMKCRNCDSLMIEIREVLSFGYKPTLRIVPTCKYWLDKNRRGYRNAWYAPTLNSTSCTQFIKYRNNLDIHDISVDGIIELTINSPEEMAMMPIRDLVDKGYNHMKMGDGFCFSMILSEDDENENS